MLAALGPCRGVRGGLMEVGVGGGWVGQPFVFTCVLCDTRRQQCREEWGVEPGGLNSAVGRSSSSSSWHGHPHTSKQGTLGMAAHWEAVNGAGTIGTIHQLESLKINKYLNPIFLMQIFVSLISLPRRGSAVVLHRDVYCDAHDTRGSRVLFTVLLDFVVVVVSAGCRIKARGRLSFSGASFAHFHDSYAHDSNISLIGLKTIIDRSVNYKTTGSYSPSNDITSTR